MEEIEITTFNENPSALEFLIQNREFIPMSMEKPCTQPTNSEIRRWLDQSSVVINGSKPKAKDKIAYPVTSLVFFPKSAKKRVTIF